MSTKFKVIGRRDTRPKHLLGIYCVPDEALWLTEDIMRIEMAMELLGKVDLRHITSGDAEFGRTIKSVTLSQIRTWLRHARLKLATEYLAK